MRNAKNIGWTPEKLSEAQMCTLCDETERMECEKTKHCKWGGFTDGRTFFRRCRKVKVVACNLPKSEKE